MKVGVRKMNKTIVEQNRSAYSEDVNGQRGSAIVIALFVLALISVFVALAMTRSSAEAAATGNEVAEGRTFYSAQGSLETMTRNFNKVFEVKLNPSASDLDAVRNGAVAGMNGYTFQQELEQTSARETVVMSGGSYAGLYAIRDNWRLRTTATDNQGIQVQLTRNVLNSRIPIFQFGIFYDDDLELFRPPRFSFGGRVHSNRNFFVSPGTEGVYFNSKVTAAGHIVTQSWRNWYTGDSSNSLTYIKNASGVDRQLTPSMGSVLNTTSGSSDNIFASDPDYPPSRINSSFTTQATIFDGNLQSGVRKLILPLKVGYPTDLVELVKRGKSAGGTSTDLWQDTTGTVVPVTTTTQDDNILRTERYANKPGIRVSLSDSKAKLPGCATSTGAAVTGTCGVRLEGHPSGDGSNPTATPNPLPTAPATAAQLTLLGNAVRGYQPRPMRASSTDTGFSYRPTRLNGERFYTQGAMPVGRTQEVWIKVELVSIDPVTQATVINDVTQDFLSLGVTEEIPSTITMTHTGYTSGTRASSINGSIGSPSTNLTNTTPQTASTYPDSRSIIKLQRFMIPGDAIPGSSNVLTSYGSGTSAENIVRRFTAVGTNDNNVNVGCSTGCTADDLPMWASSDATLTTGTERERFAHLKRATISSVQSAIVPVPIKMFDTREGEYYDERSTTYYTDLARLTRNGVMSMIDIDVANLRRFFRGDFNGLFPVDTPYALARSGVGLRNSDVPQREGWVFYVSDRRGDADFDGELDMEDIYSPAPGNTGTTQNGEDINGDGIVSGRYWSGTQSTAETERFNTNTIQPDRAAVVDHKYYRRGVRLINGQVVPGIYDAVTPANSRGISFASENGIYVQGNYNATGVSSVPSTGNTAFNNYMPFDTATHIPSSIVGDAVTILSNDWDDSKSFVSPYDEGGRIGTTTTMRFAMISGDTMANKELTPNQGGISPNLNGGVHNFKRFLERWTGNRLDYAGSLINLYNSHNNNGSFKCCNTVYDPPIRNWVFDSTFLDPARMPPGTPFFQYIQSTGFQRTNE